MERWNELARVALLLVVGTCLLHQSCTGGAESSQDGGSSIGSEVAAPDAAVDLVGLDTIDEQISGEDIRAEETLLTMVVGQMVPSNLGVPGDVASLGLLLGRLPAGVFIDGFGQAWGRPTRDEDVEVTLEVNAADGTTTQQT